MNHTYLFEQASWEVTGYYIGESGQLVEAEGKSTITHQWERWIIQGLMRLRTEEVSEVGNIYEVVPFKQGADNTSWSSMNDALGRIEGRFFVIDDTILSIFQTPNGRYRGAEYLRQLSDHQYASKGALLKGLIKLSSWSVELNRKS